MNSNKRDHWQGFGPHWNEEEQDSNWSSWEDMCRNRREWWPADRDTHQNLSAHWMKIRPRKRHFLFVRLMVFFVPMMFVFALFVLYVIRSFIPPVEKMATQAGAMVLVMIIVPVAIVVISFIVSGMAFKRYGSPLVDIMAALDSVAEGDLSVRVDENMRGEFGKMQQSFNRMAEELETSETNRRNMTADVAHELRTPLHIIQGNLEGMLDGVYEPTKEQIGAALEETRLLSRLVNDLQTLSLAEAGKLHLHCQTVTATDLIEDTVTGFSILASENGINLEKEITGSEVELTLNADPDRLSQVLNNLVANAMRYTSSGGTIRLRAMPAPDGVTMIVEDTGTGIAPEDLPNVFERFWKAEKSRSRHEGTGSGLGLAIAHQLVQAHGGTIRVESQPGKGTCFTIDLPKEGKGC